MASIFTQAKRFPPILLRILARVRRSRPLGDAEISAASGLPIHQVHVLSQSLDWRGVDIYTMQAFAKGCGLDFDDPAQLKRCVVYLRGKTVRDKRVAPNFRYLRRSPYWATFYQPLVKRWLEGQPRPKERQ